MSLTSKIQSLKEELHNLKLQEEEVDKEIQNIIDKRSELENCMLSLTVLLPILNKLRNDATDLSNEIKCVSDIAENVSGKVRSLDTIKKRVAQCIQRVSDIQELHEASEGVMSALNDEDYEQAAAFIHRYRILDKESIRLSSDPSEGSSSLDHALSLMEEAEKKMHLIVNEKFDAAISAGDMPQAMRFFKIFPILDLHDIGMKKFSAHLCANFAERAKQIESELSTSAAIVTLLEIVGEIIEAHQPIFETYYGPGKLIDFLKILQGQCDAIYSRLMKQFRKKTNIDSILSLVNSISNEKNATSQQQNSSLLDSRTLDPVLDEMASVIDRSELYIRFLRRKLGSETFNLDVEVERFVQTCGLSRCMHELVSAYIPIEDFFVQESTIKATGLDMIDSESFTSTIVDDLFFIIRKAINRALSTSNADGLCAVVNNGVSTLDRFRATIQNRIKSGCTVGFEIVQAVIQQRKPVAELENMKFISFLVTLNNVEMCAEYIKALKQQLDKAVVDKTLCYTRSGKIKIDTCLSEFVPLAARFRDLLFAGINQLIKETIHSKLKQLIEEYKSTSHEISEAYYTEIEPTGKFIQRLITELDKLILMFKDRLSEHNYCELVNITASEIVQLFERIIMECTFNRFGGLLFDKELRTLISYLNSLTETSVRDRFARLTQISTLLSLEKFTEINDYWNPGDSHSTSMTLRLSPAEVKKVLSLRRDFDREEIQRLIL